MGYNTPQLEIITVNVAQNYDMATMDIFKMCVKCNQKMSCP